MDLADSTNVHRVTLEYFGVAVKTAVNEAFPGHTPSKLKLTRIGRKFRLGISLDFSALKTVKDMDQMMTRIENKLSEKCDWIGEVDFFLDEKDQVLAHLILGELIRRQIVIPGKLPNSR